jgi:histone deacetylase complex subunit SAP18
MLHDADPSISTPLGLHAFRRVHWNDRLGDFDATPLGVGITRVPLDSVSKLLSDLADSDRDNMDIDSADRRQDPKQAPASTSAVLGWDKLQDEIDEKAAAITLAQINLADGDFLDCVVKPDPTMELAPKPSRPTGRERPPADRFNHSWR